MSLRTFHHRRKERSRIDYSACAIPKIARVVNPKALEAIRAIGHCEVCKVICRPHPHHLRTRAAGGGDFEPNLIAVCPKCHRMAHDGLIPKTQLRAIVGERFVRQRGGRDTH